MPQLDLEPLREREEIQYSRNLLHSGLRVFAVAKEIHHKATKDTKKDERRFAGDERSFVSFVALW
jgi:hypothetical protein